MRLRHFPGGAVIGLIVGLVAALTLNTASAIAHHAEQDETPTPAPTPEPTTVPSFSLTVTAALATGGDQNGNGSIDPGDTVRYEITATNTGSSASGAVDVVWEFDAAFISGVAEISDGGSAIDEGRVGWSFATIGAGEQRVLSLLATLKNRFPPGRNQVASTALVRAAGVELASAAAPTLDVLGPTLRLTAVDAGLVTDANSNGRIDPGDAVRFVISYVNDGGGPSQEASIVADYPEEFTHQIVNNPNEAQDDGSALTWVVGSIPADGQEKSVSFTITLVSEFPPGQTTYDLDVLFRAGTILADQRTLNLQVAGPSLTMRPSYTFVTDVDADGLADAGDTIQVTLTVENVGSEEATNTTLTYEYTVELLDVITVDQEGTDDPETGVISWAIGELRAGQSEMVTFQTRVLTIPIGTTNLINRVTLESDQTSPASIEHRIPVLAATPVPEATPTAAAGITEVRPAQGQGLLSSFSVAILIGAFLLLSLLSLTYVASRVLPSSPEERHADDEESRIAQRRLVRELVEGIVLTAILFSVMVLGLQNTLDQDSVNSIVAGIVGYVAGRVASQG